MIHHTLKTNSDQHYGVNVNHDKSCVLLQLGEGFEQVRVQLTANEVDKIISNLQQKKEELSPSEQPSPYKKITSWVFNVKGELWRITGFEPGMCNENKVPGFWVFVEKVRNNGQEDTHMTGEIHIPSKTWNTENISTYSSETTRDAIADYIELHGTPKR